MPDEIKNYPKVTTGAVIVNATGKVFLMRDPVRFEKKLYLPGGHVEWGESIEKCLAREVKEETGLTVHSPELIRVVEFIFSPVYDPNRHIIPVDYAVKTDDPENGVILDGREGVEYAWLTEEQAVASDDIEATSKETIAIYFKKKQQSLICENYKQSWQRALADYANLQKEVAARRQEWAQMSEQMILEEFIPVYDNFKKAFAHHPELNGEDAKQIKNWIDGIGYIQKQFGEVLKNHNVEEIKTVGETFDPKLHEAAGEAPSSDGVSATLRKPGTIVKEVDGGYTMGGRVIKVAKVIIAK